MSTLYKKVIDASGRSDPWQINFGSYFLSIAGNFGGATANVEWRAKDSDDWKILQDNGTPKEISADYNEIVTLPGGQLALNFATAPTSVVAELHRVAG